MAQNKTETGAEIMPVENLICIKQLPIIEEQLHDLKTTIEEQTASAMSLVCTDETVQTVKTTRADLNKKFDLLEQKRKEVKAAVLTPYNHFEAVYKECVTDLFKRADGDLKKKIDDTETAIKRACEDTLQAYFCELRDVSGLPWLEYERAGIKVDMASAKAKTPKKLMEQIKAFVDGVAQSVKTIESMDDAPEIMVEYKATLDMGGSIATVQQRKKRAEQERQEAEERARRAAEQAANAPAPVVEAPEAYSAPKAVKAATVERLTVTFSVTDTRERLKLLKAFLVNNGYEFK